MCVLAREGEGERERKNETKCVYVCDRERGRERNSETQCALSVRERKKEWNQMCVEKR